MESNMQITMEDLIKMVNEQGADFVIHVEFQNPVSHPEVLKEYGTMK